jgi:lipopolysaccharide export system protein LptC
VDLESIKAQVTVTGRGTTDLTAEAGSFDNGKGSLVLRGAIEVTSSEGYGLRMTDAAIDFKAGTMRSPNPVSVRYQDSETVGDSIAVSEGGNVIVLEGRVRTVLMPPERAEPATEPAATVEAN